ncbi:SDR family NAD(P)-dependent oxidoreductase [Marinoscillum furvescens]|uniref:2-deoxy-D-gluconate 3-dehydrogenase n=1 Tax=Marinoscillum furvescens DSM 4134 TaxID=1122208 RepID=A0A3D9L9T9_MARFU|nr:SDR family NAD(P)-dependent oxidoreductase [Marinoscillum furvescens]REE02023.1 2-deoxy-D-gluconate 3-dehydrogenase [Marinoscillum furvescens DSM 4134]
MKTNPFDLSGQLAVVTGCKRGIGKAMALALAEAGADIIGVSATLQPDDEVARQVCALGRRFDAYSCDFNERAGLQQFIAQLRAAHDTPHILLNNAGTIRRAAAADHPDAYWGEVIDVNLNAPFILAREIGKDMLERGSGKIIFTASLLTFQGGITVPGYAASKGAIGQLTKALANEWADKGLNVNALAPGYIATDNTEALRKDTLRNGAILERIPQGRWGQPTDLAGPVVFLSSRASDYINGTILTVDGGWMGR